MDYWFETEVRARHDDARSSAHRSRTARLASRGRSTGVRARLADHAQAMSDRLAHFATRLRGEIA